MYPILGSYGPFFLYTLTFIIWLTITIALALTTWRAHHHPAISHTWPTAALVTATSALFCGRLAFIITNLTYYQEQPKQLLNLWQGGFYYPGLLLGGLLALMLWCAQQKQPLTPYLILFTPALLLLHAAGWLACFFEACAFGTLAPPAWFALDQPDDFGVLALRYPTQLLGFLLTAVLALLSTTPWVTKASTPRPTITLWFLLALIHLVLLFWRGDIALAHNNFSIDLLFAALFCGFTARLYWRASIL